MKIKGIKGQGTHVKHIGIQYVEDHPDSPFTRDTRLNFFFLLIVKICKRTRMKYFGILITKIKEIY